MATDINNLCMSCMTYNLGSGGVCANCGTDERTMQTAAHWLRPRTILNGKYLVGKVLGEGGFGITYIGWNLNLDIKIAIKEYYPGGYVTRDGKTTVMPLTGQKTEIFTSGRDKFVDEAKRLAKFNNLPGIVAVTDFFTENGTAYIVMEYIDGRTLKEYLAKMGGKIPADQVFEMMKPVMTSLAKVHSDGLIHRDISPDNIMISSDGSMKLLDFGAAREYSKSSEGAGNMTVMLKPGFAPEEQYRTRGVQGPWTDVYALAATMYVCITGTMPEESFERIENDRLIPPGRFGALISPQQEMAILRGMAVRQNDRFQNMTDFYTALYGPVSQTGTGGYNQSAPATYPPQTAPTAYPPQTAPTAYPPQTAPAAYPPQPPYNPQAGQNVYPGQPTAYPGYPGMPGTQNVHGGGAKKNKAMAGVLIAGISVVVVIGIVLLAIFPGDGDNKTPAPPTLTPAAAPENPTATPAVTATPTAAPMVNDLTGVWEYSEGYDKVQLVFYGNMEFYCLEYYSDDDWCVTEGEYKVNNNILTLIILREITYYEGDYAEEFGYYDEDMTFIVSGNGKTLTLIIDEDSLTLSSSTPWIDWIIGQDIPEPIQGTHYVDYEWVPLSRDPVWVASTMERGGHLEYTDINYSFMDERHYERWGNLYTTTAKVVSPDVKYMTVNFKVDNVRYGRVTLDTLMLEEYDQNGNFVGYVYDGSMGKFGIDVNEQGWPLWSLWSLDGSGTFTTTTDYDVWVEGTTNSATFGIGFFTVTQGYSYRATGTAYLENCTEGVYVSVNIDFFTP